MPDDNKKDPISVDEARHRVRHLLPEILENLAEIQSNQENRPADRNMAIKLLLSFVSEIDGDQKMPSKMSPKIAAQIAALKRKNDAPQTTEPPDAADEDDANSTT